MLAVAVVGAGPSGLYAAEALMRRGDVRVDVLDRLPCPFGLVRYGVAPDHPKIKSITATLRKVIATPGVRFLGNVELGTVLPVARLHHFYDAVVFATGAATDRRLGIPGEDLPGSRSSTEFVAWYNGHPDAPVDDFRLDAERVVVVGLGNVALDVVRILARTPEELAATDLAGHVRAALADSKVRELVLVGRRGPADAKFTTKELRELGAMADADVLVDPTELPTAEEAAAAAEARVRNNLQVLRSWAAQPPVGRRRRIELRFFRRPVAVLGRDRVEGLRVERVRLDPDGRLAGTGAVEDLPAELVIRAAGYLGRPVPGVPFDPAAGVVPHDEGRVLVAPGSAEVVPGEYVTGWIKRGPTGVIGTNKSDAAQTVASLLADADAGRLPAAAQPDPDAFPAELARAGIEVVGFDGWVAIEAAEAALGAAEGRDCVKISARARLLAAARGAQPGSGG